MKKCCSLMLALLLLLGLSLTAYGAEEPLDYVEDYAGLLTGEEEELLQQQLYECMEALQLDIVIVTTYGTDGKGVQVFADDFYDSNGYGYGSQRTGILLLLDMEAREWYMSTCGEAIYMFTDYGLEQLGEAIFPWLADGAYYWAFHTWLEELEPYVDAYRAGSPVDGYVPPDAYESPYGDEIYHYDDHVGITIRPFPTALVIGLAAAVIAIFVMRGKMNTAKLQRGAADYLKDGSFHLRQRSDMFLYSRVSRQAKPKNNSSGGGSSVHRSSGGISHGGRGGRF